MRLAIVSTHPVQYYAPLFRELHQRLDLTVFYGHRASPLDQARAGFGVGFEWDTDLMSGYHSSFLDNKAKQPGTDHFSGIDTPDIQDRLKQANFDAVMLIGWHRKFLLQALWAAKCLRMPVVVRGDSHLATPRSTFKRVAKQAVYPVFLRQFDAALAVGLRNRDYWRHYRYPEARIFDSPHCVDNQWFAERATESARLELRNRLGIAPTAPVALFAGKLLEFKQPLHLIEAAALVRAKGLPLEVLVAGDGPLKNLIRQQAAALGVPLHLLGFCNQTQMPAAYAASDVLVLPSSGYETWGLVANEALACGKPVIVADSVGCAPDMESKLGPRATYRFGQIDSLADKIVVNLENQSVLILDVARQFSIASACDGIISSLHILNTRSSGRST